jgi:hypothetical protein
LRTIEGRVPARVVLPVAENPDLGRPRLELLNALERFPHVRVVADDADVVLHEVLQGVLDLVRPLAISGALTGGTALERRQRRPRRRLDLRGVD